jgi:hypothetical protein
MKSAVSLSILLQEVYYLREAAKVIYAADRHAKKELKKQVRGVRAIERSVAISDNPVSKTAQSYCLAVRSALTDDGRLVSITFSSPPASPS